MREKAKTIALLVVVVLCSLGLVNAGYLLGERVTKNRLEASYTTLSTADMVGMVNSEREKAGLPDLKENPILDKTAELKACDMLRNNYFAHEDLHGESSWHLFTENGYYYQHAGENLARNNNVFEDMRQLMESPTHRENILRSDYKDIGIGKCGQYTVQHFGSLM